GVGNSAGVTLGLEFVGMVVATSVAVVPGLDCPVAPEEVYVIGVPENDLKTLYVEANIYALASHLFWSLWGLIQAKMSPIDFDYLDYFFLRYKEYKRKKEKHISMALSYLSECRNE
ncbi:putative ethanolamine kinase A-like protein, partial [Trifolium pratense]